METRFSIPRPRQHIVSPAEGAFCEGGTGVEVRSVRFRDRVTYTLIRGITDLTPTVAGTGNPISFGLQTEAGTYTVEEQMRRTTSMTGSAIVTITPLPAQPEAITGPSNPCPSTAGFTYEVPEVPGATSYTWSYIAGTITSGQGTRTVASQQGSSDGIITVYASNACGNSTTSTLWRYAVQPQALPQWTSQITIPASGPAKHSRYPAVHLVQVPHGNGLPVHAAGPLRAPEQASPLTLQQEQVQPIM